MKKITLLAAIAIVAATTTSCRKPRTCTCTDQYGGTESSTIVATKKVAKTHCDNMQTTYGSDYTCALD